MYLTFYPILSGWQDSNLRPPAPKAGAITGLRYTPIQFITVKFQYSIPKFQCGTTSSRPGIGRSLCRA